MVFKAKYANEIHRIGDTRARRKFAWLPVRINDDIIWLETFETLYYYSLIQYPLIGSQPQKMIDVYEWVKIKNRILPKISFEIKTDKI